MDLLSLIAQLIAFVLAFLALIFIVIVIQFFSPKKLTHKSGDRDGKTSEAEEPTPIPPKVRHLYEKYPPIETFEFLYWRGVHETWKYNVFSLEIIKYAEEHLPLRHLEFTVYNSNKHSDDYARYKPRIEKLRKSKTLNFSLVVINYDQEFLSIESEADFEAIKARIDAEWDRYYGLV